MVKQLKPLLISKENRWKLDNESRISLLHLSIEFQGLNTTQSTNSKEGEFFIMKYLCFFLFILCHYSFIRVSLVFVLFLVLLPSVG